MSSKSNEIDIGIDLRSTDLLERPLTSDSPGRTEKQSHKNTKT